MKKKKNIRKGANSFLQNCTREAYPIHANTFQSNNLKKSHDMQNSDYAKMYKSVLHSTNTFISLTYLYQNI